MPTRRHFRGLGTPAARQGARAAAMVHPLPLFSRRRPPRLPSGVHRGRVLSTRPPRQRPTHPRRALPRLHGSLR